MDLYRQISSVVALNDYIELTQDVETKHKDVKIVFNMSTILCLKKIRSLEIEYFNKCDGNGAALKLFERMLSCPASKTWGLLGLEVIGLIQYWLDAVRKHLISHHIHWWMFLKQILFFIKELRLKDNTLSSLLVEEIAESMLDLATSGKPDVNQRYEILHTFNLFCAESSREIRLALKTQFEPYFIRLSTIMATCGHLPGQLAALEALLRWLQPRQHAATRRDAAAKWFLPHLYCQPAVDIFLTRTWMNFFQDARDFLNCHNETKDLVTSVICKKLSVGDIVIISGEERRHSWLDINSGSRSITVVLEPQQLEALGVNQVASCETFTLEAESAKAVKLYMNSTEVTLSVETEWPPSIVPSGPALFSSAAAVSAVLSSRDLPRVDAALRNVFQHKYEVLLDVHNVVCHSPLRPKGVQRKNSMEEHTRFSHINPAIEKRRKPQVGYVAWSRRYTSLKSPSTASTGSLAQLHDKLANLPYYEFTKEPVSVCAQPELSVVNELNESQISNSLDSNSTLRLRRCAVRNFRAHVQDKAKSDGETVKNKLTKNDVNDNIEAKSSKGSQSEKYVKKTVDVRDVSSLFAATIGSADNSVINATIERLPKGKDVNTDNLIDLLVQEALNSKANEDKESDSGINTEDGKKSQEQNNPDSETIEDTQYTGPTAKKKTPGFKNITPKTPKNKVVNKSTSDESNTEAINETPLSFVNVRKRNQRRKSAKQKETKNTDEVTFDNKEVEDFFSQHFAENQMGDVIISPTLAKKINESTSVSSDELLIKDIDEDFDIRNEVIPDLDIVECLNDVVDKVCSDFEKCSEYLNYDGADAEILNMAKSMVNNTELEENIPQEGTSTDETKEKENKKPGKNIKSKGKKTIKLKFSSKKKQPKPPKGKLKLEPVSKMSTILEETQNIESDANKSTNAENKIIITDKVKTPLTRRKRKLYSPKDDQIQFDRCDKEDSSNKPDPAVSDNEDDMALSEFKKDKVVTPKSTASCYKEIEKERKKYKRIRARKTKSTESPPSPKTKRLDDVFEKLKDNIEVHENEKIILVDKKSDKDVAIFNFTSDSEDEDFKQKKIEVQKRTSTTTIGSGTSVMSTRRGSARSKAKNKEDEKESANENAKPAKRKRATRRRVSNTKSSKTPEIKIERPTTLIDEKMREAIPEELNTSFVAAVDNNLKEPEPIIKPPELEVVSDENANIDVEDCIEKVTQKPKIPKKDEKKATKGAKKAKVTKNAGKKQDDAKLKIIKDDDRTISPLPGLVIEQEIGRNEVEDSLTTNVVQKFQKIYKEGPDAFNDTITTQNMLSDNEKANSSLHMNITEEMGKIFGDESSDNSRKDKDPMTNFENKENSDVNIIDDTINSDQMSKISKAESSKSKRHKLKLKRKNTPDTSANINSDKENINALENTKIETQKISDSQKSKKSVKSHIDEIDFNEIICVDTDIITRSKVAKCRSSSKEVEVVNISADSEINSERSIATEGITGHGDMNELPPSPKLLKENLSPRELQDMDPTIREYYIELSSKVNNSKNSSVSRKVPEEKEKSTSKETQRVSEEDSNLGRAKTEKEKDYKYFKDQYDIVRMLPSRRETESESSSQNSRKTPNVSVTRLSSNEITKWLSGAKSTRESSVESAKTNQILRRSVRNAKHISSQKLTQESSSETEEKRSIRTVKNVSSKMQESSFETGEKTDKTTERSPKVIKNRKSQISPIKLDEFMPRMTRNISKPTNETLNTQDTEMSIKLDSIARKYFLRPTHESSPISRAEKSEESTPQIASKRKSPISKTVDVKRRKLDEEFRIETVDLSSTQSSNVEGWLKSISAISKVDAFDASSDALQNLMEKLDTTLAEIHQNTTKDFIALFVEAQRQLVSLKEERRRAYRTTAVDILTNVTRVIDQQFAEMDQRASERDSNFMSWLRSRAAEVLRRDCRQKRAMVAILRDDVQAVADHLQKNGQE